MKSIEKTAEDFINVLESKEVTLKEWKAVYNFYTGLKINKLNEEIERELAQALIKSHVITDTLEDFNALVYFGSKLEEDLKELNGHGYKRHIINGLV